MSKRTFIPPEAVAKEAQEALDLRASLPKSRRCCTPVGIRRASQLANRQPVSVKTLKRMKAYFDRHEVDKEGKGWGVDSKGWQAWLAWGGDSGRKWAEKTLKEVNNDAKRSNPFLRAEDFADGREEGEHHSARHHHRGDGLRSRNGADDGHSGKTQGQKEVISFDFDQTLQWYEPPGTRFDKAGPNESMLKMMLHHMNRGQEIIIVTARNQTKDSEREISAFIKQYNLPVKRVYFTNQELKAKMLDELGVSRHYDDSEEELDALPPHIEGKLAPLHPDWYREEREIEKNPKTRIFRAQPAFTNVIRTNDYVTKSRKFAGDHAVTSAIYNDEPFHVVIAFVDDDEVGEADNPGEFRYLGKPVKGFPLLVADTEGNLKRAKTSNPARPGDDAAVGYVRELAETLETERGLDPSQAMGLAWSIACKYKRDEIPELDEHCTKEPEEYLMTRNPEEDFIQRATEEMEEEGTEGSFTQQARRAGYSDTLEFAEAVMAGWRSGSKKVLNKKTGREQGITLKTMRRANFAINAQKRRNPGEEMWTTIYEKGSKSARVKHDRGITKIEYEDENYVYPGIVYDEFNANWGWDRVPPKTALKAIAPALKRWARANAELLQNPLDYATESALDSIAGRLGRKFARKTVREIKEVYSDRRRVDPKDALLEVGAYGTVKIAVKNGLGLYEALLRGDAKGNFYPEDSFTVESRRLRGLMVGREEKQFVISEALLSFFSILEEPPHTSEKLKKRLEDQHWLNSTAVALLKVLDDNPQWFDTDGLDIAMQLFDQTAVQVPSYRDATLPMDLPVRILTVQDAESALATAESRKTIADLKEIAKQKNPRRSHGIEGEIAGLHAKIFREDDGTFYYTVTDKEGNTHAGVALSNKEALQKVRTLARSLSANPAPAQDSFEAVEEILIEEGGAAGLKALKPAFSKPSQAKARLAKMPGIMQHETGDYALREGWDKPRRNPLHNYLVKDRKGVDVALTTTMEEAESVKPKGGSIHAL